MALRGKSSFYVNGIKHEVSGLENGLMLAEWLRKSKGLTGTKIVCAEGDCGACTVLKATPEDPKFRSVNSCIALVGQIDGSSIVTIEGIAVNGVSSPVQEAMTACHGSQCGYCTPGFVMAMTELLESGKPQTAKAAANALTGNLCRCTGYKPILDAAVQAKPSDGHMLGPRYFSKGIESDLKSLRRNPLAIEGDDFQFFAPTSLTEAAALYGKQHKTMRIIGSTTDLGVQYNKGKDLPKSLLSLHLINELRSIKSQKGRIFVGATVDLTTIRKFCQKRAPEFSRLLNVFASPQIKNSATLAGNVANASPIGDTMPYLLVSDAWVHTLSWRSGKEYSRTIPLREFYLGYKKLALKPGEFITHISFQEESSFTKPNLKTMQFIRAYKVSARKDLDISAVSMAARVEITPTDGALIITRAEIALGGVAATPIRSNSFEKVLRGYVFTPSLMSSVGTTLANEIQPLSDARGSATYRKVLVENLLARFSRELFNAVSEQSGEESPR